MKLGASCVLFVSICGLVSADTAEKSLGLVQYEAKDWENAIAAFAPVLASDPSNEEALFYTGKAVLQEERFEDAIPYFERLTSAYPQNADYWMWLGRAAGLSASEASVFRAKKFVNILKDAFGKALAIDPAHGPTLIALVQFYAEAPFVVGGSMKKSRAHAEAAAGAGKAYEDMAWGIYYSYEKDFEMALEHLNAACDAGIAEGMAYVFLGRTYAALGKTAEARAAYERALQQDDGGSFARRELSALSEVS